MKIIRPGILVTMVLLVGICWALGPFPGAVLAQQKSCEYLLDILSVSLDEETGQPAAIAVTRNSFKTYRRNLGLDRGFGRDLAGKRVLDVGAGLSDFVDVMADTYGAEAVAIDLAYSEVDLSGLSPECLDLFHRRRIAMDAHRLLFPSNYFDLVVSHSLLKWFFLFDPESGEDPRPRIKRGMDILAQMVRVVGKDGEVRTTDLPDPDGAWYAENHPELVDAYRAAFREFMRPYAGERILEIAYHYDDGQGYTVIQKRARFPRTDARGAVSVIHAPRRPSGR